VSIAQAWDHVANGTARLELHSDSRMVVTFRHARVTLHGDTRCPCWAKLGVHAPRLVPSTP